jgi:hypothetical protein
MCNKKDSMNLCVIFFNFTQIHREKKRDTQRKLNKLHISVNLKKK